jgi:hypothetical protein
VPATEHQIYSSAAMLALPSAFLKLCHK